MLVTIDYRSRVPIYEQLVNGIRDMALKGILEPGYKLPAVRTLALELAINPNTIQKAYTELERQGIIYSFAGKGSFISESLSGVLKERKKELICEIVQSCEKAIDAGVTYDEVIKQIDAVFRTKKD